MFELLLLSAITYCSTNHDPKFNHTKPKKLPNQELHGINKMRGKFTSREKHKEGSGDLVTDDSKILEP
jgi:hypothetical protein